MEILKLSVSDDDCEFQSETEIENETVIENRSDSWIQSVVFV
jgi:hypothetical protein